MSSEVKCCVRQTSLAAEDPEEMRFWLERSMSEGNLSNLLVLFRHKIKEGTMALKERAATHFKALAIHILERTGGAGDQAAG